MNKIELKPRETKTKPEISLLIIFGFAVALVIAWQLPYGKLLFYPFTLLSTWFHELGHGLAAIAFGGDFVRLEVMSDGSGYAVHTGAAWLGNLGNAAIAGSGLIMPSIAGSVLVLSSLNKNAGRTILLLLGILLLLSVILWIRSLFGIIVVTLFGLTSLFLSIKAGVKLQSISLQFLGVQAFAAIYLNLGYLFISEGNVGGENFLSDTEVISRNLLLPYWFWGGLLLAVSIAIIIFTVIIFLRFSRRASSANQERGG